MKVVPNNVFNPFQANVSHCVKSVRIWSYSGPHFPEFGLNTERYSLRNVIWKRQESQRLARYRLRTWIRKTFFDSLADVYCNLYKTIDFWLIVVVATCKIQVYLKVVCATLFFFTFKGEHLWNKERCLFHFESTFSSWGYQILTFQIFKCHEVMKCQDMKYETLTE